VSQSLEEPMTTPTCTAGRLELVLAWDMGQWGEWASGKVGILRLTPSPIG
jgi:hypothetical protein